MHTTTMTATAAELHTALTSLRAAVSPDRWATLVPSVGSRVEAYVEARNLIAGHALAGDEDATRIDATLNRWTSWVDGPQVTLLEHLVSHIDQEVARLEADASELDEDDDTLVCRECGDTRRLVVDRHDEEPRPGEEVAVTDLACGHRYERPIVRW